MKQTIAQKKSTKFATIFISAFFLVLNSTVLKAQVTDAVTPPDTTDTTDMAEEIDETETDDTNDTTPTSIAVPIRPDPNEQENTGGSSGGGSGAIVGLLAIGAVVVLVSSKKKTPAIQKTFVYDKDIDNGQTVLMDLSQKPASLVVDSDSKTWKQTLPTLSLQIGSHSYKKQTYSFTNLRLKKIVNANISLSSDIGARFLQRESSAFGVGQWFTMSVNVNNVFKEKDKLSFIANNTLDDNTFSQFDDGLTRKVQFQGYRFQDYRSLFLDKKTRFELAYTKPLVENQHIRFQLSKNDSTVLLDSKQHYRILFSWQRSL